jgi:hypothetical protein
MGQKRTWDCRSLKSALPPKADISSALCDVCFVPKADVVPFIRSSSARAMSACGKARSISRAALRLTDSVNLAGSCTAHLGARRAEWIDIAGRTAKDIWKNGRIG